MSIQHQRPYGVALLEVCPEPARDWPIEPDDPHRTTPVGSAVDTRQHRLRPGRANGIKLTRRITLAGRASCRCVASLAPSRLVLVS